MAKFDVTKLGNRQTREIAQTGAFRTSRGDYRDATGKSVKQPTTTLTPVEKPQPTPLTNPDGTVDAEKMQNGTAVSMPEPTTPNAQEVFQTGLNASIETARTDLETVRTAERDAAIAREDKLTEKLTKLQQINDPTQRATYAQEERILQNQLNTAENASLMVNEDLNKRRAVVSELDKLLTQSNQLITMAKNRPVAVSVLDRSVDETIQTVQARAGVLEAVVSGLDGNITQAHSIISNASTAVAAKWKDVKEYNEAYLKLVESGELAKNKIHNDYAKSQVDDADAKLAQLEETKKHIETLMTDPKSAQFIADAGITLNDSVEEINKKMRDQSQRDQVSATINDLTMEGYEYVPFGEGRDDVVSLEVGGRTLYFVPPVEGLNENIATALSSGATESEIAQLNDPALDDRTKLAIAQSIIGRGANEMRDLDLQDKRLNIAVNAEQLKQMRAPKVATRSTQVIEVDGTKQLIDSQTGEVVATFGPDTSTNEIELARDTAFVNNVDMLKTHEGLNSAVGPVGLARFELTDAFGAKDEFIGSVENIVKQLTLNTFAEAKAKGMTFGAMSQGEWKILGDSATKISNWRQLDEAGNVTGYDISEKDLKKELDVISNFGKMDALRKGVAPGDVGVQIVNGEYHTINSDGSVTILDIKPQ